MNKQVIESVKAHIRQKRNNNSFQGLRSIKNSMTNLENEVRLRLRATPKPPGGMSLDPKLSWTAATSKCEVTAARPITVSTLQTEKRRIRWVVCQTLICSEKTWTTNGSRNREIPMERIRVAMLSRPCPRLHQRPRVRETQFCCRTPQSH